MSAGFSGITRSRSTGDAGKLPLIPSLEKFHGFLGDGCKVAVPSLANLVMRRYRRDLPGFWRHHAPMARDPFES